MYRDDILPHDRPPAPRRRPRAQDALQQFVRERDMAVPTHLFGQEINAETYAICRADLLLKGEGAAADNIVGGSEHSAQSDDASRRARIGACSTRSIA